MALERWTASPPEDFLHSMMLWIRMRNIPADFFTTKTMLKLASEIGEVEELAYDPKVSHTKDYIRALVTFKTDNPLKASRKLTIPGEVITIGFEYEKIHKRCFHCLRMTHEKIRCPLLRRGSNKDSSKSLARVMETNSRGSALVVESTPNHQATEPPNMRAEPLEDDTERLARIERVKQGIAETLENSSARLPKITQNLDKGKGHVFDFSEPSGKRLQLSGRDHVELPLNMERLDKETESASSSAPSHTFSAPALVATGFHFGRGRVTGNQSTVKSQRRRPPSWKRKTQAKQDNGASVSSANPSAVSSQAMKRKSACPLLSLERECMGPVSP
ncbi:hypothetical protein DY000_02032695 [Brassica cretica]|uniref:Zinc knuckle CX2CX4HX4C domain-containing protein n=1 Tax=Brassica cretica TaxID=69181 RepID=A0ABQ7DUD0_BRACR|nr:hypothetical protein DY000_02032695 [Brassica cretica]